MVVAYGVRLGKPSHPSIVYIYIQYTLKTFSQWQDCTLFHTVFCGCKRLFPIHFNSVTFLIIWNSSFGKWNEWICEWWQLKFLNPENKLCSTCQQNVVLPHYPSKKTPFKKQIALVVIHHKFHACSNWKSEGLILPLKGSWFQKRLKRRV